MEIKEIEDRIKLIQAKKERIEFVADELNARVKALDAEINEMKIKLKEMQK